MELSLLIVKAVPEKQRLQSNKFDFLKNPKQKNMSKHAAQKHCHRSALNSSGDMGVFLVTPVPLKRSMPFNVVF